MSIITTYVCDLSGYRSENLSDFAVVQFSHTPTSTEPSSTSRVPVQTQTKHFSLEKAKELGFEIPTTLGAANAVL